jgi:signal recognition particle subunit SRP54
MFANLTEKINGVFDKLKGRGVIDDSSLNEALREIRVALLESDVSIVVAKDFIEKVRDKAFGQKVVKSITPAQMVVKIVNDELTKLLGSENPEINLKTKPPILMMMVGLQGSGKTTSTAKLANWLEKNKNKKVMMASLDIYRPAAQEQLVKLGSKNNIQTLDVQSKKSPLEISKLAIEKAKSNQSDILILDSAGRNHIDKKMMNEIVEISSHFNFAEIFLVSDSMTGQDAVNTAKSFSEKINLSGIILTRVDGDSRGGAALSMRFITQKPIKFIGVGEKINDLEVFHPDRIANRILGMGDVVTLVEKATEQIDQEDAKKLQSKILKGRFSLHDYAKQLDQLTKMGGIESFLKYLPGLGNLKGKVEESLENNDIFKKQKAIISSMTDKEKNFPDIVKASRKIRISTGSGTSVQDINKLLKQFKKMGQMMKKMGKNKNFENLLKSNKLEDVQSLMNKNKNFNL